MASWLEITPESPFSIENIPFGIVSVPSASLLPTPAIAIGEYCITLKHLVEGQAFSELSFFREHIGVFTNATTLNAFAALGRRVHQSVRLYLRELLLANTRYPRLLKDNVRLREIAIHKRSDCVVHLPMKIGDYTDFYAGLNHAYNVGVLFRGPQNALQPNYLHLPVGYHGRASTVRVSSPEHVIRRPNGQILPRPGAPQPVFSKCQKLDIELEMAAFLCKGNGSDGEPIAIEEAEDYIFGYVLMNDWSARDIQAYEYVPLGPFGSKNFATTISPWIVLADALEPFRCDTMVSIPPQQNGTATGDDKDTTRAQLLPYLTESSGRKSQYNIKLNVDLKSTEPTQDKQSWHRISSSNSAYLLYSFEQMLTHHTITGCEMNTGDLLGSGTISGPTTESMGSLLEMTQNGKAPLKLGTGSNTVERMFLQDGDEVRITGYAGEKGAYVGFGECYGKIGSAKELRFQV